MNQIAEIIESYNEYVLEVIEGCEQITIQLREERLNDFLSSLVDFSEGIEWLMTVNEFLKANGISVSMESDNLKELFNEINLGLELQDFKMTSDIIEYEIVPFFRDLTPITQNEQTTK